MPPALRRMRPHAPTAYTLPHHGRPTARSNLLRRQVSTPAAPAPHQADARALQLERIAALSARDGPRAVVIASPTGLADGQQRQEWQLPLQGVPPFRERNATQCARLVVDGLAVRAAPLRSGLLRPLCSHTVFFISKST